MACGVAPGFRAGREGASAGCRIAIGVVVAVAASFDEETPRVGHTAWLR